MSSSLYSARIKDLTDVRGSRSNQLYGYGIVTGLNGQGDSRIEYTELGILNALETLGIRADKADKSIKKSKPSKDKKMKQAAAAGAGDIEA